MTCSRPPTFSWLLVLVFVSCGSQSLGSNTSTDAGSDLSLEAVAHCDDLIAEYAAALATAKQCIPVMTTMAQCQTTAGTSLPCPTCVTHVQSVTALDEIRARWAAGGCQALAATCLTVTCAAPGVGVCMVSTAANGLCSDSP